MARCTDTGNSFSRNGGRGAADGAAITAGGGAVGASDASAPVPPPGASETDRRADDVSPDEGGVGSKFSACGRLPASRAASPERRPAEASSSTATPVSDGARLEGDTGMPSGRAADTRGSEAGPFAGGVTACAPAGGPTGGDAVPDPTSGPRMAAAPGLADSGEALCDALGPSGSDVPSCAHRTSHASATITATVPATRAVQLTAIPLAQGSRSGRAEATSPGAAAGAVTGTADMGCPAAAARSAAAVRNVVCASGIRVS
jgi:hypothetical protein